MVIEEFDWDNEWADSSYVHPEGARGCDGITWELVDDVLGASSSLRGRNLPRTGNNNHASIPSVVEDDGSADEVEEDPHDDADFTDSEDAPNESNDGEANDVVENITDEFEDDY